MAGRRKNSFYPLREGILLPAYIQCVCKSFIIIALIILNACAGSLIDSKQASGVYHRVKKGETLYKIAEVYNVPLQHLAEVNNIDHIDILEVGRVLFIPDAQAVADDILVAVKMQEASKNIAKKPIIPQKKPSHKVGEGALIPGNGPGDRQPLIERPSKGKDPSQLSSNGKSEMSSQRDKTIFPLKLPSVEQQGSNNSENLFPDARQDEIQRKNILFLWPVAGKVVSQYGIQPNGMFFNGIKIATLEKATVIAAADGVVIFSAPLKDYGETIILKHDNDYASVYTLLGQRLVKREDRVKKGDKIATLARSEMKGESLLNFEIRHKNRARNPLFFLP